MPYYFKNQFIATDPKSQHLDIPDFIIARQSDMEESCSKSLSDATNSSDIKEEIIKQINMLKPFDMELLNTIPKQHFVSKEENKYEKEINLTPQDRTGNIDCCKCGCECKPMAIFTESIYL